MVRRARLDWRHRRDVKQEVRERGVRPGSRTLTPAFDAPLLEPRVRGPWVAFSYLAIWGYLLYGLGNATPYLRDDLRLTAFEAGLHASALAIGTLLAGVSADVVARRMGTSRLLDVSVAILALAVALVVVAPLGSGFAVLIAPSALGLLADNVGVASAWPVILLVATAGLVVVAVTPPVGGGET